MERTPLVLARAHEAVAGGCALRRPTHLHTSEDTLPGVRASTDRHRKLSNIAGVRRPSQSVHASSWSTPATQRPARTHQIDLVGAVVRRPRYFRLDVRAPGQVEVAVTGAVLDHAGCLVTGVGRRIRSVENDLETLCPPHVT